MWGVEAGDHLSVRGQCVERCIEVIRDAADEMDKSRGQECPRHTGNFLHGQCSTRDVFQTGYTWGMVTVDPTPRVAIVPLGVKVHLTSGAGLEIDWKDGHRSVYTFKFLRDACPCALCEDERGKTGRKAGDPEKLAPGALPMFKPAVKALAAEAVGKYALKFSWNDNHDLGIYSWAYLREVCPCAECRGQVRS